MYCTSYYIGCILHNYINYDYIIQIDVKLKFFNFKIDSNSESVKRNYYIHKYLKNLFFERNTI